MLEQAWEKAVTLCMAHCKERGPEVIQIVCNRLKQIGRYETAADLYVSVGHYEEGVMCYIQASD